MKEKKCFRCGEVKPLSEFYKHSGMKDGYLNKCKDCTRKDTSKNRGDNKEYYLEYDRIRSRNPERVKAREDYYKKNKDNPCFIEKRKASHEREKLKPDYQKKRTENTRRFRAKNKEKYKAHNLLNNQVRKGSILQEPCIMCGEFPTEAHHPDYNFPLSVIWLCNRHHRLLHANKKMEQKQNQNDKQRKV